MRYLVCSTDALWLNSVPVFYLEKIAGRTSQNSLSEFMTPATSGSVLFSSCPQIEMNQSNLILEVLVGLARQKEGLFRLNTRVQFSYFQPTRNGQWGMGTLHLESFPLPRTGWGYRNDMEGISVKDRIIILLHAVRLLLRSM